MGLLCALRLLDGTTVLPPPLWGCVLGLPGPESCPIKFSDVTGFLCAALMWTGRRGGARLLGWNVTVGRAVTWGLGHMGASVT